MRKEIQHSDTSQWYQEKGNLDRVKKLKDRHIVEMYKAYMHGGKFNIVFAEYPQDLDRVLRQNVTDEPRRASLESHESWAQILGIFAAIQKIGKQRPTSSSDQLLTPDRRPMLLGFHFDLKPANILIGVDECWVVTDFGQAFFVETSRSSIRVEGHGGTDTYAPPEAGDVDPKYGSRYDVWSLGCILVELIAYVVGGPQAVSELDEQSRTKGHRGYDSRYWQDIPIKDNERSCYPVLKSSVVDFVQDDLLKRPMSRDSREFMTAVWHTVAIPMLHPDVELRIDIGEAETRLHRVVQDAKRSKNSPPSTAASARPSQNPLLKEHRYDMVIPASQLPRLTTLRYQYFSGTVSDNSPDTSPVTLDTYRDDSDFKLYINGSKHRHLPNVFFSFADVCRRAPPFTGFRSIRPCLCFQARGRRHVFPRPLLPFVHRLAPSIFEQCICLFV